MTRILVALFLTIICASNTFAAHRQHKNDALNIAQIEALTGAKAQYNKQDHTIKIIAPRNDITLSLNGIKYVPAMGLSSALVFKKEDDQMSVSGDLVLTENQVNTVMSTAINNGIRIIALVNHSMWEEPRIMFMHIEGEGKPEQITGKIAKIFAQIKATQNGNGNFPIAQLDPINDEITHEKMNTKRINMILGAHGILQNGIYKIAIGETASSTNHHTDEVKGVNTWAAFAGTEHHAVVDGNLAVHQYQLQNVLTSLRKSNIDILAIDSHANNNPQDYVFLHFYGLGHANSLAKGLRTALQAADKAVPKEIMQKSNDNKELTMSEPPSLEMGYCSTDGITTNIVTN